MKKKFFFLIFNVNQKKRRKTLKIDAVVSMCVVCVVCDTISLSNTSYCVNANRLYRLNVYIYIIIIIEQIIVATEEKKSNEKKSSPECMCVRTGLRHKKCGSYYIENASNERIEERERGNTHRSPPFIIIEIFRLESKK